MMQKNIEWLHKLRIVVLFGSCRFMALISSQPGSGQTPSQLFPWDLSLLKLSKLIRITILKRGSTDLPRHLPVSDWCCTESGNGLGYFIRHW